MYRKQKETVRDWLEAYRKFEKNIDENLEKLRMLKSHMMSVGAQEMSDMPKPPSVPKDRMADYVIRVEALEAVIDRDSLLHEKDKEAIKDLLMKICPEERHIIWNRYIFGLEWRDVLERVYKNEKDYDDKIETYRRRMFRVHEKALEDMAKHW